MIKEKPGPIFSNYQWNYDGITASNLNPVGVLSILQLNLKFHHIYTVTKVIHRSRNLIGTQGIASSYSHHMIVYDCTYFNFHSHHLIFLSSFVLFSEFFFSGPS